MSATSWDVITVINTSIVNQQLANQLNNAPVGITQATNDQSGDTATLQASISGVSLLPGSSGETLFLSLTLNGTIVFTASSGTAFTYQINALTVPIQCALQQSTTPGYSAFGFTLSSATLDLTQWNETAALAALTAENAAPPPADWLIQVVVTTVEAAIQKSTVVETQLAQVANVVISHTPTPVQQMGCAVQPVANGAVLFLMLSFSGSTPLPVNIDSSLSASLTEPRRVSRRPIWLSHAAMATSSV